MFVRCLLTLLASAGVIAAQAAPDLQWEWVSPLPHRQSWVDMASGNGKLVGLTDGLGGRSIFMSADGRTWDSIAAPTNVTLRRVIFAEGQFIAVGDRSTIVTSTDGSDWLVRQTSWTGLSLFDVAAGNGAYVAVGYGGVGFVSNNLKQWSAIQGMDPASSLLGVKFGNGRFVAIGQGGRLSISLDGRVWKAVNWPVGVLPIGWSDYAAGLEFAHGIFVMSVGGMTALSVDGLVWTLGKPLSALKIVSVANGFLAMGGTTVYRTPTCSNWEPALNIQASAGVNLTCAAELNGTTVVGGDNGRLYVSSDYANWDGVVEDVDYSWPLIAYGNGLFIRYGSRPGVVVSADGNEWQEIKGAPQFRGLAFGNGVWVGIVTNGAAAISETGKIWESVVLPATGGERVIFANGRFVAEAAGGIITSTDGRNWQAVSIEGGAVVRVIGNVNGRWAGVLAGSRPVTSDDGLAWTAHPAQSALRGTVFAAGGGRFLALGGGGMGFGYAAWSQDGISWQQEALTTGTSFQEESLTFGGGQFLLTDFAGGVFVSTDGLNWAGGKQAPQTFAGAAFGENQWLVAGGDSILRSTKGPQIKMVAELKWVVEAPNRWSLALSGPAGAVFQIEAAGELNGEWAAIRTVNIPLSGEAVMPFEVSAGNRFFRASAIGN